MPVSEDAARQWAVGDVCWTALTGQPGLHQGEIQAVFNLPSHTCDFYIIQMARRDWMIMEVRDATLLSRDPGELPPVMKVRDAADHRN